MASSQPSTDEAAKALTADIEAPDFEAPAFTVPPPLSQATVAIVTSVSLHHPDDEHLSYAGNQFDLSAIRIDSGAAGARRLSMRREAGVNHAVWFHLTPGER